MGLLAGALLVLSASTVFARAAESQRNFNTGTGTVTAWWRVAVAAHHLLIAGVTFTGGSGTTITPPAGWLPIGTTYRSDNGTTIGMAIYYIPDCPAKVLRTTETFTFTPSTTVATVQLTEVAGVLTTNAVDADTIATKTGTGTSIALSASSAVDETSEYGYALVASTAQTTTFGTGTNGFARTSSYLYNTSTQVTNLDAGTSHRTTMESTLMTSAAGATLSTTISTANAPFTGMMVGFRVQALYWIGAGSYPARPVNPSPPVTGVCYGYFDDDACWSNASGGAWSGTNSPGANDVVIFDAGGLGDCTMNPWSPGTELAYSIEARSGYIGAITKAAYDLQLQRHFTLAAGTFNGSAGLNFQTNQTTAYVGDLDVSGGTLNGNGMNFYVRALYVEAGTLDVGTGTFSTNNGTGGIVNIAGGTARFGGALSTTAALTMLGGNLIGGAGGIAIGGAGTLTSASLTAGAGAFSLAGALTLNTSSTCDLSAASSRTFTSNTSVLTSSTLTLGPGTSTIPGSMTVRGAGSTFNAGTTALTVGGNVTVDQSGTFGATAGTIAITGTLSARGAVSFSAGATTMTVGSTVTVDQGTTFNANSATIDFTGAFTLGSSGGALSTLNAGTSTLNFNNAAVLTTNSFLIYLPSVLNGGTAHLNFGANTASTARSFRMTGGVADMSTATVTFNGAGYFYPDGGTVTFGSGAVTMPGAMTMQGAAVNLGSIALTVSGATTLTTGSFSTGTGSATFNGTFAANGGTMTGGSAPLTFNGATTFSGVTYTAGTGALIFSSSYANTTGTANLTSASALTFGTSFSVSAGTTTFGSQVVGLPNLTVTGGVFNAGTSTVTVAGTTTSSSGVTNFGSSAAGPTFMGGVSMSGGAVTLGAGTAVMQSTLGTSGGTLTGGSGPLTIQGAVTMSGGVISLGGGMVGLQSTLTFTGNGTFNAGGSTLTIAGAISMVNGTFNGNTSTIVAQGAATFAGTLPSINSTFNANASNTKFQGPVAVGGSDGSRGLFHAMAATLSFEFATTGMSPNSVLLQGSTLTVFDVATFSPYATITFGKNTIAGTNAINLTAGTMTLNSSVTTTFVDLGEVTIGTGTTLAVGANAVTFPNTVNLLGTFLGSTGALTFSRALTVTGTVTGGSGTMTFSQPVLVTGTFSGSTGIRNFSSTLAVTGTYLSSSGAHTFGAAVTNNAGTLNLSTGVSPLTLGFGLSIGGGTTTIGTQTTSISTLTLTSGAFGVGNATMTVVGDTNITGGVATLSNTSNTVTFSGSLYVGPGTLTAGAAVSVNSRPVTVTGATTVTANGIINAGASSNFRFTGPVALGTVAAGSPGTFNGDTSTTVFSSGATAQGGSTLNVGTLATFSSVFQLLGNSAFNGGAGSSTFGLPPTLTSGTFSVGTTATTGRHTFQQNATFSSGVTLSFPSSGGRLSLSASRVLTLQGPVTAATTTGATLPKIDCNGCTATQGVTVAFASTSTLNIDGLEFNNSVSTGVSIASGATYTLLKRLKFQTNAANGGVGSTHLAIALGTATINVPGSFFDTTAATNVTLNGTTGQVRGARAIFEVQSTATNGTGAGEARDADGDNAPGDASPANNLGENVAAPYYGSVVQWSTASPTDTAGTGEGFPTAAFDWNTYAVYGVYAGYRNIGGAGTADRIWLRNADGTAAYYFDVPDSSGDVLGSPYWETSNESTMGLDVNGDGDQTDTSVHVVYVPTTGGHIIKLIDSGTALDRPASGVWTSDFTDSNVASISSPLISDATNLYFGGANTTATRIFGVQIAAGASEKTLVKDIGLVGAVTAAMSWKRSAGIVYLYVGSRATLGQAYIYRINVSPGAFVEASFAGVTSSVNGSVRLANNRAYAVTDGGQVHALDATNFAANAFVNVAGFPYQTTVARPIQVPATIYPNGYAYFGDDSGRLYALTSAGADQTGYPFVVTTAAITSSPLYVPYTGVIALGAADGYVYFIDRHNATGVPALFNRYYVGTGSVSSVSYNSSNSQFMVSSSDGKLAFIASTSVPDPTSSNE